MSGPPEYSRGLKDPKYAANVRQSVVDSYFAVGGHKTGKLIMDLVLSRGISKEKTFTKAVTSRFRYRTQLREGRCVWCRTVEGLGSSAADHAYKRDICPRYDESVQWHQQNPTSKFTYTVPAFLPGGCPLAVSKGFWQKLYLVGTNDRLDRLKNMAQPSILSNIASNRERQAGTTKLATP